jgi:hypothetical protein
MPEGETAGELVSPFSTDAVQWTPPSAASIA